jgi:hypothetical protein
MYDLLTSLALVKVKETFVDKSILKSWEAIKHKLVWNSDSLRAKVSVNNHWLGLFLVVIQEGSGFPKPHGFQPRGYK